MSGRRVAGDMRRGEGFTISVDGREIVAHPGETRIGMGRCQGRYCLETLAALVADAGGIPLREVDWPRPRPPARPVCIADLLHEALPPPELPADAHGPRNPSRA